MMKLHFDLNRLLAKKLEDQKGTLPAERELNEQELALVTGGWDGHGGGWHQRRYRHYRRYHHHRYHHYHDD